MLHLQDHMCSLIYCVVDSSYTTRKEKAKSKRRQKEKALGAQKSNPLLDGQTWRIKPNRLQLWMEVACFFGPDSAITKAQVV